MTAHWPRTSAILAGWICVSLGLFAAWIFPPANLFFSVGIVLSIVAMATYQVRAGLLLLAGSLTGLGVSVLLFMCGLATLLFHVTKDLPEIGSRPTPNPTAFRSQTPPPTARGPVAVEGTVRSILPPRPVPLTLGEVSAMLNAGRNDDEIIAAASSRPPLGRIGVAETTTLRAYGASPRLIEFLQTRFAPDNSPQSYQAPPATATFPAAQTPLPAQTTRMTTPALAQPTPIDYAARDRKIADLRKRLDDLDEQVRRVRADPHWQGMVKGSTYTTNQQASDAYLKELDRQRDDLRRQKWALEGR